MKCAEKSTIQAVSEVPVIVVCAWCVLSVLPRISRAQETLVLTGLRLEEDTAVIRTEKLFLTFSTTPPGFPIYAMSDPRRIVIDLPDTRTGPDIRELEPESEFIERVGVTAVTIDGSPNVRIQVFVKKDVHYSAFISGSQVVMVLKTMDTVVKTVPVFTAQKTSPSICSISGIEIRAMQKSLEIDVVFTVLPEIASIYMLDSPPRIVMDFNDVFIDKGFEKQVNVPPVKDITVIKRRGDPPYAGVVVNVTSKVPFEYEQLGQRIQVRIPWETRRVSKRGKIVMIGTGLFLAGGFVTGVILSSDKQDEGPPGPPSSGQDLGTPPAFPDQ
jgi:hypothetical protein